MPEDKKRKKKVAVYKITADALCGITHGCPDSSTLVHDLGLGKVVKKVQVYKDDQGDLYLVLKD